MYVDKPMGGHNLMQAIARVNRVFKDKPGGLVVDYLGLADSLKKALADYTASDGKGDAVINQQQAVNLLLEKYEIIRDMLHGFDYQAIIAADPAKRIYGIAQTMEFILNLPDGKKRYLPAVASLNKAFALAVPDKKALAIRNEIKFFQEIKAALVKASGDETGRAPDEMDTAIKQLVSRAISSKEVVDIFAAAGMQNPDISIFSDEFLQEVKALPQRNLAFAMLKKLINDEIKSTERKNIVQARSFAKMLEEAVRKYQNRAIETVEVIQELINIAKELRKTQSRSKQLKLNDNEIAFYDALATNASARDVMGDERLRTIAQELVNRVKQSVSIDWTLRENARAEIRVIVKRILRKYGYPPDLEKSATDLVLEQAETLCRDGV
jgi:type I restriction enzyme R subunit